MKTQHGKIARKSLYGLTKWLRDIIHAMKASRDRDAWKVMIAYAKE